MRLAVLDVGSNTVHLVVVEPANDGGFYTIARERETLRLAEAAYPSQLIPDAARDRLIDTVDAMRGSADEAGAARLVAIATSAIREARNGVEVLGAVRAATGVSIAVLPGADEARLTYKAARRWAGYSARRLLVLDIGGGSLEVAGGEAERPELAESVPLGASRLTRRFIVSDPAREQDLVALRVHALALLGPLAERIRASAWDVVCATSKTFRSLAGIATALPEVPTRPHDFGFAGIDGRTVPILTRESLNLVAGYLATTSARDRNGLPGLGALRADTVVAGSQVAALAMQAFGLRELVLCPWALREGVILEHLDELEHVDETAEPARDGPRRRAVFDFARRYASDDAHCRQVTQLALTLFDQTTDLHGLGPAERELLEFAAILHDVGLAVAQSAHHKHSLYLILNSGLEGFDPRELAIIANVARYHRRALPAADHPDYAALGPGEQRTVRRLSALLRIADGLDADHFQVISDVRLRSAGPALRLDVTALDEPSRDVWSAEQVADLFEAEFGRRLEIVAAEVV